MQGPVLLRLWVTLGEVEQVETEQLPRKGGGGTVRARGYMAWLIEGAQEMEREKTMKEEYE